MKPKETLLTRKQVADYFGVHVQTIWRWVREGRFPPPIHISDKAVRWRVSDIDAFVKKLQKAPLSGMVD